MNCNRKQSTERIENINCSYQENIARNCKIASLMAYKLHQPIIIPILRSIYFRFLVAFCLEFLPEESIKHVKLLLIQYGSVEELLAHFRTKAYSKIRMASFLNSKLLISFGR